MQNADSRPIIPENIFRRAPNPFRSAKALVYQALKHRRYRKFIVLSRSRSGSNMLASILGSHPNIRMKGEMFGWLHGRSPEAVLRDLFQRRPRTDHAVGCKVFYYHPHQGDAAYLRRLLLGVRGLHVIHLKRRNVVRTIASQKIAATTDQWVRREGSDVSRWAGKHSIHLSPEELWEKIKLTQRWEAEAERDFRDHPMLEVHYEDLVAEQDAMVRELLAFLGVRRMAVQPNTRRQNPEPLSSLIENYEELRDAFAGTPYAWCFDA